MERQRFGNLQTKKRMAANSCGLRPPTNYRGGLLEMDSTLTNLADRGATTVAVVDRRPDDYAYLLNATRGSGVRWEFARNGCEALRLARTQPIDVWMVNDFLPDMSGLDVCALLKGYLVHAVIYIVTDNYDQAIEREARIRGAMLFECKPIPPELIDHVTKRNRHSINGRRTFNPQTPGATAQHELLVAVLESE
jgi:CheY-like chemotaxis protein